MFHIGPEANEISRRALEPAAQILRGVVVQYTNRCFDDFSDRLVELSSKTISDDG